VPVTVTDLLADPRLELRLHTSEARVDRPLSWVHVSELADPTPFLEGGELLLTTGLALRNGEPAAEYVSRLVAGGVAALGVGTGLGLDVVPRALVKSAQKSGLAVLEVPRHTPFIAISRSVSSALAADEYAAVARSATVQQELARAALGPGAPGTVIDRLVRALGGWAVLLDASGQPLHAVPSEAAALTSGLRHELVRLRAVRAPASAALSGPSGTVLLQSLGHGDRTRAFLAVGRPDTFPAADRHVVNATALVLTLRLEQSRALDGAMAALRAALLRLLLEGEETAVAAVVDELGEQLPEEPLRVLAVLGSSAVRAAAVDAAADAAGRERAALFAAELDEALVLLGAETGPLPDRWFALAERLPGVSVGAVSAVAWSRLSEGVRQARQAAEAAATRGGGVLRFEDLAAPGLAAMLDPRATRAFAASLLSPLVAADRSGPGDLMDSLRVWLTHHGQWDPAATQLGIHRHTLRRRVRRAAELLDRDLEDPGTRAELWVALHPPA
jgi:purine catabolism regulator